MKICLDSSAWIELFTAGPNAKAFADAASKASALKVPTIVIYEVRRHALAHFGVELANEFWSTMIAFDVIELDANLAASAAETAATEKLAMADAIILTTARLHDAELWTQDVDFKPFEGVRYFAKAKS